MYIRFQHLIKAYLHDGKQMVSQYPPSHPRRPGIERFYQRIARIKDCQSYAQAAKKEGISVARIQKQLWDHVYLLGHDHELAKKYRRRLWRNRAC